MTRVLSIAAALALFAACVPQNSEADRFASVLPDDRILVDLPAGGNRDVGQLSDYYVLTAQVTGDINDFIGGVLILVDHVTEFTPSWSDDSHTKALWGPWDDGPLDPNHTILWVEYHPEDDSYTWAVAQRDKDAGDDVDWTPVVAGEVDPGSTDTTGSGRFAVDFDAMHAMNPVSQATGLFVSEYDVQGEQTVASAIFQGFSEDGTDPGDASYHYEQVAGGDGLMDLGLLVDTNDNGTDEAVIVRSRWTLDGAGRSDAYLTQGDLGDLVFTASECWDTEFTSVYYVDNFTFTEDGDASACVFDQPDYNPDDPES